MTSTREAADAPPPVPPAVLPAAGLSGLGVGDRMPGPAETLSAGRPVGDLGSTLGVLVEALERGVTAVGRLVERMDADRQAAAGDVGPVVDADADTISGV